MKKKNNTEMQFVKTARVRILYCAFRSGKWTKRQTVLSVGINLIIRKLENNIEIRFSKPWNKANDDKGIRTRQNDSLAIGDVSVLGINQSVKTMYGSII